MKAGKLSLTEKYAIKGMLHENKDVKSIAEQLKREEAAVQEYIDTELSALCQTIADTRITSPEKTTDPIVSVIAEAEVEGIRKQLMRAGLTDTDATRAVSEALKNAGARIQTADQLYTECIKRMRAGQFMNKRTVGGAEGVAVMTSMASQRGDSINRKLGPSRSSRKHIFCPKTGEIK